VNHAAEQCVLRVDSAEQIVHRSLVGDVGSRHVDPDATPLEFTNGLFRGVARCTTSSG